MLMRGKNQKMLSIVPIKHKPYNCTWKSIKKRFYYKMHSLSVQLKVIKLFSLLKCWIAYNFVMTWPYCVFIDFNNGIISFYSFKRYKIIYLFNMRCLIKQKTILIYYERNILNIRTDWVMMSLWTNVYSTQ